MMAVLNAGFKRGGNHLMRIELFFLASQRAAMKFFPIFFRHAVKRLDNFRIKLPARPFIQLLHRSFVRSTLAVNAITGDSVKCISDGKDARANVDLLSFQSQRIS